MPIFPLRCALSLALGALSSGGLSAEMTATAALERMPEGAATGGSLATTALELDGRPLGTGSSFALAAGPHNFAGSYAAEGSSVRAEFHFNAEAGRSYQVEFEQLPRDRLALWIADVGTRQPVTTKIFRIWLAGPDKPLIGADLIALPDGRYDCAVAGDAAAVYLVGGKRLTGGSRSRVEILTEILRVDRHTHACSVLTRSLARRPDAQTALVGKRIYILGLEDSLSAHGHSMQIFDLNTGELAWGPPMPEVVHDFSTATVGDRIYVLGGWSSDPGMRNAAFHAASGSTTCFDCNRGAWLEAPALPTAAQMEAVNVDGRIFAVGGLIGEGTRLSTTSKVQVWTHFGRPVVGRKRASILLRDLSYLDDQDQRATSSTELAMVEMLDPGSASWKPARPLAISVHPRAAVALNGKILVFAADDDAVQMYDPVSGDDQDFRLRTSTPGSSVLALGNRLYVVGGGDRRTGPASAVNAVYVYRLNPNWSATAAAAL